MLIGHFLYYLSKSSLEPALIEGLNVNVSVKLINFFSPDLLIVQNGRDIKSTSVNMTVATGCDGMDGILIILSAMLAFPMACRYKLPGLASGILVVYLTNIIRIVLLFYILLKIPEWFDFFHIYIGQFMVIFAGGIFFLIWVSRYGTGKDSTHVRED